MKVAGRWCYLYRAIDREGVLLDSMRSEHRDKKSLAAHEAQVAEAEAAMAAAAIKRASLRGRIGALLKAVTGRPRPRRSP